MSREELKSDHRDTEVEGTAGRPGRCLKVLVVGEQTLQRETVKRLRDQGVRMRAASLDRFRLVTSTYRPDAIVCSERCLLAGLNAELKRTPDKYSVVVLQHERDVRSSSASTIPDDLLSIAANAPPLQIAALILEGAQRRRDGRRVKPSTTRTLPSAVRTGDTVPQYSYRPAPPPNLPSASDDEPTSIYASRRFVPGGVSNADLSLRMTPPAGYQMGRDSFAQDSLAQDSLAQDSLAQDSLAQDSLAQGSASQRSASQRSASQRSAGQRSAGQDAFALESTEQETTARHQAVRDTIAQDATAPDSVAQDSVAQDSVAQDSVAQDSVAPDSVAPDSVAPDSVAQDSVAQDSAAQHGSVRDTIAQDATAQDSTTARHQVVRDTIAQDSVDQDSADQDLMARDTELTPSVAPAIIRVPSSKRGPQLDGVRVALVDVNPTRTDALAMALRARGVEVHIASLDADRPHFRLLRRFAPHALLIDEDVLAGEGVDFLQRFRNDPFLQHTPLLTLRFDRLFRVRSGTASVESIQHLLEPLGRSEADLLSRLGPSREVEFDLDQFPPHRLMKMLARRSAPTTIVCTREKETLRWTVARGKIGHAELWHAAQSEPHVLPVDEALDWLLSHRNCHVVLIEPSEFDDITGREIIPLVESKESGMWELPQLAAAHAQQSRNRMRHRPSSPESHGPESLRPDSLRPVAIRPAPLSVRILRGRKWPTAKAKWVVGLGAASLTSGALLGLLVLRGAAPKPDEIEVAVSAATREGIPAPQSAGKPPAERRGGADAGKPRPVKNRPSVDDAASKTNRRHDEPSPTTASVGADADQTEDSELSDPDTLFLVTSAEDVRCDDLLHAWARPRNATKSRSNSHFRMAQRLLLDGKSKHAHVELCKSALLDPGGPGSERLAQFALGERATLEAERWIREVLKQQPESTSAKELLGDILHQQGRHEEALEVWFETLKVDAKDMAKRKAVARVWVGHARTALGGSDYPRAERGLRRALAFDPSNAQAASLMAVVFRRRGIADRAVAWDKEAARLRGAL